MRFLTHMFALLVAITVLMTGNGAFAKSAKSKNTNTLSVMTFKQVARLPHQQRVEYIQAIRQAVRDAEKMQKVFDDVYADAGLEKTREKYAVLEETMGWLFGSLADAETTPMECIHSGNVSTYPKPYRVPFRCEEVKCDYNPEVKGSGNLCNFSAFGTINATGIGCIKVTNKARSTDECWENRQHLIDDHKAENTKLLAQVDEYFGFGPNGEFNYKEGFDSETAKNLISKMMVNSYDDRIYAQLIKANYFYVNSGKCFGPDLPIYEHVENLNSSEKLQLAQAREQVKNALTTANGNCGSNEFIEKDFNKLNEAAAKIFKRHKDHCAEPLDAKDVAAIKDGTNLYSSSNPNGARKGSSAYQLESERQKYLAGLPPGQVPTHENVLEVTECRRLNLMYSQLEEKLRNQAGTFPRAKNGEPPKTIPVDPWGPDDRYTKIEPTGCTENVTKEESHLSQESARCMACIIQNHEAKEHGEEKDAQTYRTSKKYLSLVSTMALACGDGRVNDTAVLPEVMVDYWAAFGHCSSETYTWNDQDEQYAAKLEKWSDKMNVWRSSGDKKEDKKKFKPKDEDHPDHKKLFARLYGISFSEASKVFCPEDRLKKTFWTRRVNGYKAKEWNPDRREVFEMQRKSFLQFKKIKNDDPKRETPADGLMACFKEAEEKIKNLKLPEPPQDMDYRTNDAAVSCLTNNFLTDPPVMFARSECFIPKQRETVKTLADNQTPCLDKDRNNKDDKSGKECSGKPRVAILWTKASANKVEDGTNPEGYRRYTAVPTAGDHGAAALILSDVKPGNSGRSIMQTQCLGPSAPTTGGGTNQKITK